MKVFSGFLLSVFLFFGTMCAQWSTFGGDPQRTSWARTETVLNKNNASTLELKWKIHLDNVPKEMTALTTAVVADQVKTERGIKDYVIVAGSSDNIYAIDGDTGKLVWQKTFTNSATADGRPNTLCPFGLNATPVVQAGRPKIVYAISADGKLHALNAVNGDDRFPPVQFSHIAPPTPSARTTPDTFMNVRSKRLNP
jgi:glucose dehydrogenase